MNATCSYNATNISQDVLTIGFTLNDIMYIFSGIIYVVHFVHFLRIMLNNENNYV